MHATTSLKGRKQVADAKQQVILQEHKFYVKGHEYFFMLRAARHSFSPQSDLRFVMMCSMDALMQSESLTSSKLLLAISEYDIEGITRW